MKDFLSGDSHDVLHRFGLDEDGDGVQQSQLQSLDGVPRHVQDAVFPLETTEEEHFHHRVELLIINIGNISDDTFVSVTSWF